MFVRIPGTPHRFKHRTLAENVSPKWLLILYFLTTKIINCSYKKIIFWNLMESLGTSFDSIGISRNLFGTLWNFVELLRNLRYLLGHPLESLGIIW